MTEAPGRCAMPAPFGATIKAFKLGYIRGKSFYPAGGYSHPVHARKEELPINIREIRKFILRALKAQRLPEEVFDKNHVIFKYSFHLCNIFGG